MSAGRQGRRARDPGGVGEAAHQLRSSLNTIHTWAHVLETRLAATMDSRAREALGNVHGAIAAHARLIENLREGDAVQPPLRRPAMSKRNDAQPELPDDPPRRDRPQRPEAEPKEQPGGSEAAKAEQDARNKSTRSGER